MNFHNRSIKFRFGEHEGRNSNSLRLLHQQARDFVKKADAAFAFSADLSRDRRAIVVLVEYECAGSTRLPERQHKDAGNDVAAEAKNHRRPPQKGAAPLANFQSLAGDVRPNLKAKLHGSLEALNERLADLMRRMGICEEKGSGVDKVILAIEAHQLHAPDFRAGFKRFSVILLSPRPFEEMDRIDRTRACYQHCCLKWVTGESMTNQSLRARFHQPEGKTTIISQIIAAAIEAKVVKPDAKVGGSRKFARYLPFWA